MGWYSRLFGRAPAGDEEREGYTDGVMDAQYVDAERAVVAGRAVGLEIAAGMIGRCFALAQVLPADLPFRPTRRMMLLTGRQLAIRGEIVWFWQGEGWHRAGSWDVQQDQSYKCTVAAPVVGDRTVLAPRESVLHFRYAEGVEWWRGLGPLQEGSETGRLASNLELLLANESEGAHGYVIAMPKEGGSPGLAPLVGQLRALKGKTMLVRSTLSMRVGDAATQQPYRDWVPQRYGMAPPEVLAELRRDVRDTVLASCGIPPALIERAASDAAGREVWRAFVVGTLEPLGALMLEELEAKNPQGWEIDWHRVLPRDTATMASAARSLREVGVGREAALRLAGFELEGIDLGPEPEPEPKGEVG